jgi:hypothetical protein
VTGYRSTGSLLPSMAWQPRMEEKTVIMKSVCAILLSLFLVAGSTFSCKSADQSNPVTLEEKALPPVFTGMEQLWGRYFNTSISSTHNGLLYSPVYANPDNQFQELDLKTSLPAVPERMTAYTINQPNINEDYARGLAQRFGFPDNLNFNNVDKSYVIYKGGFYQDNSPTLFILQDGKVSYFSQRRLGPSSNLPSDQDCIKIAREWLETYHLYPDAIVDIKASKIITQVVGGTSTGNQFVAGVLVTFQAGLDGYPLFDPGALVTIGDGGTVLQVEVSTLKYEPFCYVKVQPPEAAMETFLDYLRHPEKFRGEASLCLLSYLDHYYQVDNFSLKYFAMLSTDRTQLAYAQPVYILEGGERQAAQLNWDSFKGAVDAVVK